MLNEILGLIKDGVTLIGGALIVWGGVKLGLALKDRDGTDMAQAVAIIVGGAVVGAAGLYFGTLNTGSL